MSRTADVGSFGSETGGPFLGPGLKVSFQGSLHVEVVQQRFLDEFWDLGGRRCLIALHCE